MWLVVPLQLFMLNKGFVCLTEKDFNSKHKRQTSGEFFNVCHVFMCMAIYLSVYHMENRCCMCYYWKSEEVVPTLLCASVCVSFYLCPSSLKLV